MALNIYLEAKNQSVAGQIAVGFVVNFVKDRRFPNGICEVIYEGLYVKVGKLEKTQI